jgi:fatty acyl-CoA reductase
VNELVYPPPADPEKILQCVEWLEEDLLDAVTPKQVVSVLTITVEGRL